MQILVDVRLEGHSKSHAWSQHKGLWALGHAHHLPRNQGDCWYLIFSRKWKTSWNVPGILWLWWLAYKRHIYPLKLSSQFACSVSVKFLRHITLFLSQYDQCYTKLHLQWEVDLDIYHQMSVNILTLTTHSHKFLYVRSPEGHILLQSPNFSFFRSSWNFFFSTFWASRTKKMQ